MIRGKFQFQVFGTSPPPECFREDEDDTDLFISNLSLRGLVPFCLLKTLCLPSLAFQGHGSVGTFASQEDAGLLMQASHPVSHMVQNGIF